MGANVNKAAMVLACLAVVIGIGRSAPPVRNMLAAVHGEAPDERGSGASAAAAAPQKNTGEPKEPLRRLIERKASELRQEPLNARVDRVWKAIPGYNGREVDVEATYRKASVLQPGEQIPYVFRQIKPEVSLEDLGAQPIYRGNPAKPFASLMINVAWGNEFIKPMLDILDEEKVKATFFLDGTWLSKNRELALEIKNRGHEMENHAYTHPNMSRLSRERAQLEIAKTKDLLKSSLGVENKWFAPPSGDFNAQTVEIAQGLGLKTVLWTLDTVDWRHPPADAVVAKITSKAEPGSLILMHPTDTSSQALRGMIRGIRAKGLRLATVSETLSAERPEDDAVE
ncbi:polysaccharide deacetylase family protein [Paenibacillus spiritus]|uniref:Polysaccharide deacetylase family protein n=1 Tax=Paenibacillus spiritus TaxID=2496557 RepID=A0A5J5GEM9_9BACL|nr:polysaccharide deacetylase family protein [Paenibacillus spiritus]KAA9006440.1 polysaccharide deacetylase family protein [Paenibacillus spiritus]